MVEGCSQNSSVLGNFFPNDLSLLILLIVELSSRIHKWLGLARRVRTTISLHLQYDFKFQSGKSHTLYKKIRPLNHLSKEQIFLPFHGPIQLIHTQYLKKKMTGKRHMRGALLKKDSTASLNRQLKKILNFTFILRWNDLIYSAVVSEDRADQVRFLGNCPPKS